MFEICMLASGSSGNAVYIASEETSLLIDAGFSGKKTEALLSEIGVRVSSLDALLVSHEHSDHICGVGVLSRRYKLPVFATEKTWHLAARKAGALPSGCLQSLPGKGKLSLNDITVETFPVPHDAAEPVGFLLRSGRSTLAFVTDLGYITPYIADRIKTVQCLVLEANHDEQMLIKGKYPWSLKRRILGTGGHLSNHSASKALSEIICPSLNYVVLAHLSEENNDPSLAYDTVGAGLQAVGCRPGKDISLQVAKRSQPSCYIRLP